MAKKKQTMEEAIRGQHPASVICTQHNITLPTLQKKVGILQDMDKKYYDIEGLWEKPGNIKYTKMGIIIHYTRLMNSNFTMQEDEFEMDFDDDKIILTKIK